MSKFRKFYPWAFGLLLTGFTTYSVLDTFVIPSGTRTAEVNTSFQFVTQAVSSAGDTSEKDNNSIAENVVTTVSGAAAGKGAETTKVSGTTSVTTVAGTDVKSTGTKAAGTTSVSALNLQDLKKDNVKIQSSDPAETEASSAAETEAVSSETEPPQTDPPETDPPQTDPPVMQMPDIIPENDGERLYMDENIRIGIKQYREYDTNIYVADVVVSSLGYLKTAFAENTYGRNVSAFTSDIANGVGALFAVNGDYYGAREHGYVIRNGVLYRDQASSTRQALMIKADSSFEIVKESETNAQALVDAGAYQVFTFGPGLVRDRNVIVSETDEVAQCLESNPRTAIGYVDYNHFIFVVSDGRTAESKGLSLYELAGFLIDRGASTAYNLDGGGSSSMVFMGNIVNVPTTNGHTITERGVSDIVYIGY